MSVNHSDSLRYSGAAQPIALGDEAATLRLGASLGELVAAGDVIYLTGDLGAGKTTLARGLIGRRTGAEDIPSPTYNLVQIYSAADLEIWHLDLYRIKDAAEIHEIGLDEALGRAVCLIEWPERLDGYGPAADLTVHLTTTPDAGRNATLTAGPRWETRLAGFRA